MENAYECENINFMVILIHKVGTWDVKEPKLLLPNQKFSWEHSGIKVGNVGNLLIILGIMAGICRVY